MLKVIRSVIFFIFFAARIPGGGLFAGNVCSESFTTQGKTVLTIRTF
jgi:hypothetical protein